ncbi:MAG TPA: DUF4129 domain-containing protein [Reyranella sp.]|nr:DUF4129 domain-containing protein [Reyranella sp.]
MCLAALIAAMLLSWQAGFAAPPAGSGAPNASPPAAEVHAAVAKVYGWGSGYQRTLPDTKVEPKPPEERPRRTFRISGDFGSLAYVVLIGLVVVLVVALAMGLASGDWKWLLAPGSAKPKAQTPPAVSRERAQESLHEADRSAVAGDWGSAIHILLLTSIDLLRRRVGQDVPAALTSRELVGVARVDDQRRGDFAALVQVAELCHFGGRPADKALYDRCRAHYERLWGTPPESVPA